MDSKALSMLYSVLDGVSYSKEARLSSLRSCACEIATHGRHRLQ